MEKIILKHLTVRGFVMGEDLTNCDKLQRILNEAKLRVKIAKKEAAQAKFNLSLALEESLKKIESDRQQTTEKKQNAEMNESFSATASEQMKKEYDQTIENFELKKNEIKKKLEEFQSDEVEEWGTFKQKLKSDLEELEEAMNVLKGHIFKNNAL